MDSAKYKYKVVKVMNNKTWRFIVKRKGFFLFGWSTVCCDYDGNIEVCGDYIKRFNTEADAEEAIKNLLYNKEIEK